MHHDSLDDAYNEIRLLRVELQIIPLQVRKIPSAGQDNLFPGYDLPGTYIFGVL